MIERYSRKVMRDIWTEENKFDAYLKVEILSCEAWSELGVIPKEDVDKIRRDARFDVARIQDIEEQTRHDVVAFTRAVSESLGEERKWVHYGLTSTDVVDTANGYLIKQADAILLEDLEQFLEVLRKRAIEFKSTPCIGRTHGVHADITSFGLKWAQIRCCRSRGGQDERCCRQFCQHSSIYPGLCVREVGYQFCQHLHPGSSEGPSRFLYVNAFRNRFDS